ncbi:hypothetical protein E4T42_09758 [Aureobasidium subglaciale]|nr:hypothetical protein E4T42_09758 [Aureobasidium subglaciale]
MAAYEQKIQCAIDSYNNNEFPSIRATARAHVVAESTLRSRINRITNRRLTGYLNKELKGSLLLTLVLVRWLVEFSSLTGIFGLLGRSGSLNSYKAIHVSDLLLEGLLRQPVLMARI